MAYEDGFKFGCSYCGQHIKAFTEHIGMWLNCPSCESEIEVPDPFENPGALVSAGGGGGGSSGGSFSVEEMEAIAGEPDTIGSKILSQPKRAGWAYSAMADLLSHRIHPLQRALYDTYHEPNFDPTANLDPDLLPVLHEYYVYFVGIVEELYTLFTEEIIDAFEQDDLVAIVAFSHGAGKRIKELTVFYEDLHRLKLPERDPFPELHYIMSEWPSFMLQCLVDIVAQLQFKGVQSSRGMADPYLEVSLFPPSLPQFQYLVQKIEEAMAQAS